eukprot:jgi/Mesvir1/6526/Mv16790-RA.1
MSAVGMVSRSLARLACSTTLTATAKRGVVSNWRTPTSSLLFPFRPNASLGNGQARQRAAEYGVGNVTGSRARRFAAKAEPESSRGGGNGGAGGAGKGGSGGGGNGGSGSNGGEAGGPSKATLGLWAAYLAALESSPLLTKSITSALLNLLGDLVAQLVIETDKPFDLKRSAVTTTLGLGLVGPVLHYWYGALNKYLTISGTAGAVARLALDQFLFAPIFICAFFSALLTLEGRPQEIVGKLKQDWGTVVVNNWKVWIPFQFINFRLVPPNLQVAGSNVIALVWNMYLSFAMHTTVKKEA